MWEEEGGGRRRKEAMRWDEEEGSVDGVGIGWRGGQKWKVHFHICMHACVLHFM